MKLNKNKKVQAKNIPDSNQWKKVIEKADEIEEKIIRNPAYGKGYELDSIKDKKNKKTKPKKSSTTTTTTTTTTYNEPKEPVKFPGFPGAVDLDELPPPPEVIDLVSSEDNDDTDTETEDEDEDDDDDNDEIDGFKGAIELLHGVNNKLKF